MKSEQRGAGTENAVPGPLVCKKLSDVCLGSESPVLHVQN